MGVISKGALFFENSPKRQAAFEAKIRETEQPNKNNAPARLMQNMLDLSL